jgi:hypothetical protein
MTLFIFDVPNVCSFLENWGHLKSLKLHEFVSIDYYNQLLQQFPNIEFHFVCSHKRHTFDSIKTDI